MMHARRDSADEVRQRGPRERPAGWLFALLVMCFAVLPHVTFAASMMQMPAPQHARQTAAGAASAVEPDQASSPCHPVRPTDHRGSAKPPCCIVGCGLIAEAPMAPLLLRQIGWSRLPPPVALATRGRATEPAEPPPRSPQQI